MRGVINVRGVIYALCYLLFMFYAASWPFKRCFKEKRTYVFYTACVNTGTACVNTDTACVNTDTVRKTAGTGKADVTQCVKQCGKR